MNEENLPMETVPVSEPSQEPEAQLPDTQAGEAAALDETGEAFQPVEVIRVEDLLDRLLEGTEEEVLEEETDIEETVVEEPEPVEVAGTDEILQLLETIQQDVEPHPFLTTNFEDYTVTEGLLLLALLLGFISACFKMLKEGFSWL